MKTLIVGFTPYHSHVAAHLIDEVHGEVYCAFTKVWPDTQKPYRKIGGIQRNLQGSWLNAVMTCHFFILLNWWRWTGQKFQAFIPHPSHLLTNAIFSRSSTHLTLFLYEDGLLNYHDAPATTDIVGWQIRWLSRIFGFPYRHYSGHLSGCDERAYDGAYLSQPDHAVRKNRLGLLHRLKFHPPVQPCTPLTVLFLDQDTSHHLTEAQRNDCLNRMFDCYPEDRYQYHYKPHHDFCSDVRSKMRGLRPDQERVSAEALLQQWRPSHIVSFFSSALMNIKNSHPDIECVSIAAGHVNLSQDGVKRTLKTVFQGLKIECI